MESGALLEEDSLFTVMFHSFSFLGNQVFTFRNELFDASILESLTALNGDNCANFDGELRALFDIRDNQV